MTNISVNFLHLFFLLLSLGAMDQANQGGGPLRGARAAPVLPSTVSASPSRRGSIVVDGGPASEAATPDRRGSLLAGPRVASVSQVSARRLSSASISSDRRRDSISGTPGRRMSSVSITPESRMGSISNPSGRRMISLSAAPDRRRSALAVPASDLRRKSSYGLLSTIARDIGEDDDDDDEDALSDDDDDDPDSSVIHFPVIKGRNASGTQGVSLELRELESKSGAHPQMLLQHHLNTANAKLARMAGLDPFTEEDRANALQRRRESIIEDVQRRSLQEPRRVHSGRFGFAPSFAAGADSKKDEAAARRALDFEEQDPLTPNAIPVRNPFEAREGQKVEEDAAEAGDESVVEVTSDFPLVERGPSEDEDSHELDRRGTYNIAKLGFPKAALKASESEILMTAEATSHSGSLGLAIEANDIGYIANVTIGGAGAFRVLIDSGSADTWVPSTACTDCGSHKQLGSSTSSTYKSGSKNFSITYGTGSLSGHTATDTLKIGGYSLQNKTLGVATKESTDFSSSETPFDGLMGLANAQLASTGAPTPIDSLYSKGLVSQPVMGYHLGRSADGRSNNDGEVTFGGVNSDKYTGSLTVIDNYSTQGFWEAKFSQVSFGGKAISLTGSYTRSAILDTGTTLIVAPQADADAFHAAIPGSKSDGSGGYTIPCTTSKQVAFTIGGKTWKMDPRDMLFLPVDSNNLTGECVSAVSAGTVGTTGEWLFGAAFLKNVYFATNAKTNTIALGKLAET